MWTVLRIVGSATVLVAIYYLLPLDHSSTQIAITVLVIGLVVFVGLVALHVRSITRSPTPGLRAIEALAINVPLFVLLFASTYVVMSRMSASNFGARLTHTDGLYFTVTVLSTVGFGDITAESQVARLVVTGQVIADLIIFAVAVKIIVGAVRSRRQPSDGDGTQPPGLHPPLAAPTSQAPNALGSSRMESPYRSSSQVYLREPGGIELLIHLRAVPANVQEGLIELRPAEWCTDQPVDGRGVGM